LSFFSLSFGAPRGRWSWVVSARVEQSLALVR
jgi:hypothetical protein